MFKCDIIYWDQKLKRCMKRTTKKRIESIYNYIIEHQKVTTKELADIEGVSPEMIRRDLAVLEEKGSIFRVHGGAEIINDKDSAPFKARVYENKFIKDELCRRAVKYINDGDTVFIDASSTALQLGRMIRIKKNITLVTNCIETMKIACDNVQKVILVGGEYSKSGDRTIGYFASRVIDRMMFDIAFLGTDGCKDVDGPGTLTEDDIQISEWVLKHSRKKVLMMDSTKFSKTPPYIYANFEDFDILITDKLDCNRQEIRIPIIEEL